MSDPDELTFKALVALQQVAAEASSHAMPRNLALAFALAYLRHRSGAPRTHYDGFWHHARRQIDCGGAYSLAQMERREALSAALDRICDAAGIERARVNDHYRDDAARETERMTRYWARRGKR